MKFVVGQNSLKTNKKLLTLTIFNSPYTFAGIMHSVLIHHPTKLTREENKNNTENNHNNLISSTHRKWNHAIPVTEADWAISGCLVARTLIPGFDFGSACWLGVH